MKNIKIRSAKFGDLKEIVNLHLKNLPTLSVRIGQNYLLALYQSFLKDKNNHFLLVACHDQKIVGSLSLTRNFQKTSRRLSDVLFNPKVIWTSAVALLVRRISLGELVNRLRFENYLKKTFKEPYMTILTFFVAKNYQHQGIGSALLSSSLKLLPKKQNLYVDTEEKNLSAQRWYENHGFKKINKIYGNIIYVRK